MTTDPNDLKTHTQTTFQRQERRTHLRETFWTFTGMRSVNASYSDGLHSLSFITYDRADSRQTVFHAHRTETISIDSDDELALCLNLRSNDGVPLTIHLHDVTLSQLMEALDTALLARTATETA